MHGIVALCSRQRPKQDGEISILCSRPIYHHGLLSVRLVVCPSEFSVLKFKMVFTARIASAVLATAIPSLRPTVCLSHAGIVSKRRHVARCSLHYQIAKCV